MKFVVCLNAEEFLTCDSCGTEDFDLSPGEKLCADDRYKSFSFYKCRNCPEAGFWTHDNSIDGRRQIGVALVRRRAAKALVDSVLICNWQLVWF